MCMYIYTNKSKRTNEIKEHRHIHFMSTLPKANAQRIWSMIDVSIRGMKEIGLGGVILNDIDRSMKTNFIEKY